MMTRQKTGRAPWFARVKYGRRCELRPYARAGWLLTAAYAIALVALSVLLVARDEPSMAEWIIWASVTATMTFAFILTAWRTSEVVPASASCESKSPISGTRSILIALATAALIIGGAWLGIDL